MLLFPEGNEFDDELPADLSIGLTSGVILVGSSVDDKTLEDFFNVSVDLFFPSTFLTDGVSMVLINDIILLLPCNVYG